MVLKCLGGNEYSRTLLAGVQIVTFLEGSVVISNFKCIYSSP